jgi:hypothetical protein
LSAVAVVEVMVLVVAVVLVKCYHYLTSFSLRELMQ